MGAPPKESLDYFNVDTKFETNMETFEQLNGNDGLAFMLKTWQRAYQNPLGEIDIGSDTQLRGFAALCRVTPERLAQLMADAFELKILDRTAYNERKVLTSNGIKKRIARIMKERNRKRRGCSAEQSGNNQDTTSEESDLNTSTDTEGAGDKSGTVSFPFPLNNKEKGQAPPDYQLTTDQREVIERIHGEGAASYYQNHCRDILIEKGRTTNDFYRFVTKTIREDRSAKKNFFHKNHRG